MNSMICVGLLLVNLSVAHAEGLKIIRGGTVENGGNTAWCAPAKVDEPGIHPPSTPIDGDYYMLDYAHAIQEGSKPQDFVDVSGWRDSSARLVRILSQVSPNLLTTFQEFVESTEQALGASKGANWAHRRSWVETEAYQIIEFKPEYSKCMAVLQEAIDPEIHGALLTFRGYLRTVTRKQNGTSIEYSFNGPMLRYLADHASLQLSMLLTHEWLWDHTDKLDENQKANVFLHSREIDGMSGGEVLQRLRLMGLSF